MTMNGVIALSTVISPNSIDFEADYVKVIENTPLVTAAEM